MNCSQCRELLVGYIEELLDAGQNQAVKSHLDICAECRKELEQVTALQKRLVANGASHGQNDLENAVMDRIVREQALKLRKTNQDKQHVNIWRFIMRSPITKFAAAAMILIAIVVSATILTKTTSTASAAAIQVLNDAVRAVGDVRSIHIKAQMRTLPGDNFALIGLEYDFVPIEMWKKVDDAGIVRWRIEKPQRVIVTDGNSTIMLMRPNYAVKGERPYPIGCFDAWCGYLLNVNGLLDSAMQEAKNRSDTELRLRQAESSSGPETILEIESKATGDYTNGYLKNKFISDSDNKKVYYFDAETKLLRGFEVFVHGDKGDVLIFEVNEIEYNPQIDDGLFTLELPQDVIWSQEPQVLPDNEKYVNMTPKQTAEAFFKACADANWDEFLKFYGSSRVDERIKEIYGGLEIISIGEPFKSGLFGGWFVPYEIKLRPREINVRLSNANSAKRFVITGEYDSKLQLTEEIKWSNEPEVLADNDTYAEMSPQEVLKKYYGAVSILDFNEMGKFVPDSYVKKFKSECEMAAKFGMDVQKQLPIVEVGESSWSAEQSAYFVKCRESSVKKFNLAVRNDNSAKRWVVDGGF
ncbi:MAG: zf-HC2 domain-containing protein [Sedimentisphaerales bacterium]